MAKKRALGCSIGIMLSSMGAMFPGEPKIGLFSVQKLMVFFTLLYCTQNTVWSGYRLPGRAWRAANRVEYTGAQSQALPHQPCTKRIGRLGAMVCASAGTAPGKSASGAIARHSSRRTVSPKLEVRTKVCMSSLQFRGPNDWP